MLKRTRLRKEKAQPLRATTAAAQNHHEPEDWEDLLRLGRPDLAWLPSPEALLEVWDTWLKIARDISCSWAHLSGAHNSKD